jgi:hypothetical protein
MAERDFGLEHETEKRNKERTYEEAYYMYEAPETGLFKSPTLIPGLELASIDSLQNEINEQYGIVYFEEDEEDDREWNKYKIKEPIGRANEDAFLICKEGAFGWEDHDLEYKYYGEFNKQNVKRVKKVIFPQDIAFIYEGEIYAVRTGHYDIEHEEIVTINSNIRVEMITFKATYTDRLVTIPNPSGLYQVYEMDLASID